MRYLVLLIAMYFFHTLADYNLQGWLASAKQKKWWEANCPDELYKDDYVTALYTHAFVWTCCIFIPPLVYAWYYEYNLDRYTIIINIVFLFNMLIHKFIDDLKANKKKINLKQDQFSHTIQIYITYAIFLVLFDLS
jgi:hypothetical protein